MVSDITEVGNNESDRIRPKTEPQKSYIENLLLPGLLWKCWNTKGQGHLVMKLKTQLSMWSRPTVITEWAEMIQTPLTSRPNVITVHLKWWLTWKEQCAFIFWIQLKIFSGPFSFILFPAIPLQMSFFFPPQELICTYLWWCFTLRSLIRRNRHSVILNCKLEMIIKDKTIGHIRRLSIILSWK